MMEKKETLTLCRCCYVELLNEGFDLLQKYRVDLISCEMYPDSHDLSGDSYDAELDLKEVEIANVLRQLKKCSYNTKKYDLDQ